jgi:phage terminase large subunit-like protein
MTQSAISTETAALSEQDLITEARRHAEAVCERLAARYANDDRFVFDVATAEKACGFFPRFLRHSRGKMAGKPFELEPWQANVVRLIFGWKWKATGLRVVRRVYLFIARKNGKSTFAAGLALLLLLADGERGGEVYSAAADRDQAAIVYKEAAAMVAASEDLSRVTETFKFSIICSQLGSTYKVLSADAERKHGLNPSAVIFDELHTQPKRDLFDVLHTAVGARAQPLEAYATTAGHDRHSICWEVHTYAVQVRDGYVDDPTFLPILFTAEEGDDWKDPKTWAKANPCLGTAIQLDYLARECLHAQQVPAYENTFRRLHLNQWTEQATRWLPMDAWDEGAGEVDAESLAGRRCYAGLDLSTTTDISALVLVFPPDEDDPNYRVLAYFWVPEESMRQRASRDGVPYEEWHRRGLIQATEGNVVDYDVIRARINELGQTYNIAEIAVDRWNSTQMQTQLAGDGFTVVPFGQGFASMSAPSKELEKIVVGRQLRHGGHAVLRWMAANVAIEMDPAGNIKPTKSKSSGRIDGIVGTVMGLGRAMVRGAPEGASFWETMAG